jgi:hypothetical protein
VLAVERAVYPVVVEWVVLGDAAPGRNHIGTGCQYRKPRRLERSL